MLLKKLKNKRILILGLGREGLATLKFLSKHVKGVELAVADQQSAAAISKLLKRNKLKVWKIQAGQTYLKGLNEYDVIFKTPGINLRLPEIKKAVKQGVALSSATNLFFANCPGKIIAVTGSKGKTTTANLLYRVLKTAKLPVELVGNMGHPALDYLNLKRKNKLYVYELSSYQAEDLRFAPTIGLITSFFPEHLDYHGSLNAYLQAKLKVVSLMNKKGVVVYSPAYKKLAHAIEKLPCRKLTFNDDRHSKLAAGTLYYKGVEIVKAKDLKLIGAHNYQNVLAVIKIARFLKVPKAVIKKALITFEPLEHRLEPVGTFTGITFYNDAISTTPESAMAAIRAVPQKIGTIILGGLDRGYHFDKLAKLILQTRISNVILFPGSGPRIWQALLTQAKKFGYTLPHKVQVKNMQECVREAYRRTAPWTICLLSTASPSYNMFLNFEEKGRIFKAEVRKQAIRRKP